jgi:hypothetical protein
LIIIPAAALASDPLADPDPENQHRAKLLVAFASGKTADVTVGFSVYGDRPRQQAEKAAASILVNPQA